MPHSVSPGLVSLQTGSKAPDIALKGKGNRAARVFGQGCLGRRGRDTTNNVLQYRIYVLSYEVLTRKSKKQEARSKKHEA